MENTIIKNTDGHDVEITEELQEMLQSIGNDKNVCQIIIDKQITVQEQKQFNRELSKLVNQGMPEKYQSALTESLLKIDQVLDAKLAHDGRKAIIDCMKSMTQAIQNGELAPWEHGLQEKLVAIVNDKLTLDKTEGKDEENTIKSHFGEKAGNIIQGSVGAIVDMYNIVDHPENIVKLAGVGAKAAVDLAAFFVKLANASKSNTKNQLETVFGDNLPVIDSKHIIGFDLPDEKDLGLIESSSSSLNIGESYWIKSEKGIGLTDDEGQNPVFSSMPDEKHNLMAVMNVNPDRMKQFGIEIGNEFQIGNMVCRRVGENLAVSTSLFEGIQGRDIEAFLKQTESDIRLEQAIRQVNTEAGIQVPGDCIQNMVLPNKQEADKIMQSGHFQGTFWGKDENSGNFAIHGSNSEFLKTENAFLPVLEFKELSSLSESGQQHLQEFLSQVPEGRSFQYGNQSFIMVSHEPPFAIAEQEIELCGRDELEKTLSDFEFQCQREQAFQSHNNMDGTEISNLHIPSNEELELLTTEGISVPQNLFEQKDIQIGDYFELDGTSYKRIDENYAMAAKEHEVQRNDPKISPDEIKDRPQSVLPADKEIWAGDGGTVTKTADGTLIHDYDSFLTEEHVTRPIMELSSEEIDRILSDNEDGKASYGGHNWKYIGDNKMICTDDIGNCAAKTEKGEDLLSRSFRDGQRQMEKNQKKTDSQKVVQQVKTRIQEKKQHSSRAFQNAR